MVKSLILRSALLASLSAVSINAISATGEVTLQGVLTATTCTVTPNSGKSTLNVGTFNTKVGEVGASFSAVNTITSQTVAMPVALTGCTAGEAGELIIQGTTSTGNAEQNVFVAENSQAVGFMIEDAEGNVITEGVPLSIGAGNTAASYTFNVGMGTTTLTPEAGSYSAPILVAYLVN
jgi:type 1 fimbria pilin